ncbi:hypothetical protein GCM10025789_08940 [Tessaracoccus lubricantis]|uniref:Uncharacterized protein n=1 Tax=Tessaracoccus lubricantis TaxID=545543 RepID=A0ABP9F6N7_9ACTN
MSTGPPHSDPLEGPQPPRPRRALPDPAESEPTAVLPAASEPASTPQRATPDDPHYDEPATGAPRQRLTVALAVLALIVVAGGILAVLLLDEDEPSATPAPAPASTAATVATSAAPEADEASPSDSPAAAPSDEASPEPSEPPAARPSPTESSVDAAPEATETAEAQAQPQSLTEADLPVEVIGYTLTEADGTFAYQQGEQVIPLLALGIPTADPEWQAMLFPDPEQLSDDVLCAVDHNGAQSCLIEDPRFGVITVGNGVSSDIADLTLAIAEHLRQGA